MTAGGKHFSIRTDFQGHHATRMRTTAKPRLAGTTIPEFDTSVAAGYQGFTVRAKSKTIDFRIQIKAAPFQSDRLPTVKVLDPCFRILISKRKQFSVETGSKRPETCFPGWYVREPIHVWQAQSPDLVNESNSQDIATADKGDAQDHVLTRLYQRFDRAPLHRVPQIHAIAIVTMANFIKANYSQHFAVGRKRDLSDLRIRRFHFRF